ncbi:DUF1330 domain-containing protein [Sphingomonas bacterium]|uniref:DUF1330 domain-containing protein n=1 Tax=Sphingomonas bacterium TaxID=1895847 RepID=UPI00157575E2|nr:DUF1330 domain-containing protein [Sphingomonas bacterium]
MSALMLAQVEFHDAEAIERYVAAARPTIEQHAGKILAVGAAEVAEETWFGPNTIAAEFANIAAARAWYNSAEYQEARKIRLPAATTNSVFFLESSAS